MTRIRSYVILLLALVLFTGPALAAATVTIYPNGTATFTVPAAQYLNVFAGPSGAKVYKQLSPANIPSSFGLETGGSIAAGESTFGPYTLATVIKIEAGEDKVLYSIGALAAIIPCESQVARPFYTQLAPATATNTATILATDMLKGILVGTPTAAAAYTLPTGTLLDTATGLQINQGFEWSIINVATDATFIITLTAGATHTIVGAVDTASNAATTGVLYGSTSRWFSRKTAANTFVTYRIQ